MSRFHGSVMGIFWVLVQPIFLFAIYFAVFGVLFSRGGDDVSAALFAFYLFSGILGFTMIQETLSSGLSSVMENGNLVKKVAFPCEVLPVVSGLVATVVYIVGCAVLVIAGLSLGLVHLGWQTLAWPLLIVLQLVFSIGVGLFFAQLYVFFRDLQHIWRLGSQAWFFMTPNFYFVSMIAGSDKLNWAMDYMQFNPAYSFVMANRQIFGLDQNLVGGASPKSPSQTEVPKVEAPEVVVPEDVAQVPLGLTEFPETLAQNLGMAAIWAFVALTLGYASFMSKKHKFADLV